MPLPPADLYSVASAYGADSKKGPDVKADAVGYISNSRDGQELAVCFCRPTEFSDGPNVVEGVGTGH